MNSESKNFQSGKSEPDFTLKRDGSYDSDTVLSPSLGYRAQRAHSGTFQYRVDSNGLLSIWWDSSKEPPEPDDFKSVQEFEEASEKSSPSTQISETTIQSQVQLELSQIRRQRSALLPRGDFSGERSSADALRLANAALTLSLSNESSTYTSCLKCDRRKAEGRGQLC